MPSGLSGDQRSTKLQTAAGTGGPPPGQEQLRCPRCDSTNTKFCYYNNYNFSQPRHFCKACRRYWTHGGTLRDVPIGGGTRRNAKRSRTASGAAAAAAAMPQAFPGRTGPGLFVGCDLLKPGVGTCGNFPSVVGGGSGLGGSGFVGLGGFGLGLGSGFEEMGYGVGKGVWPFQGVVCDSGGGGGNNDGSGGESVVGNTWQLGSGEGGYVSAGDCFSWPDLAISTPAGHVMK